MQATRSRHSRVQVVLFSGGRGSQVLSRELISHPRVRLTLAVNGYDDGASTGEVRRFLGDALGPSDFRKNASRMARALRTCREELIELLDLRSPKEHDAEAAAVSMDVATGAEERAVGEFDERLLQLASALEPETRQALADRLGHFRRALAESGRPFDFGDCALGNLVFAGSVVRCGGDFNAAIEDYCGLLRLRPDLIENVTDGRDAHLVALDRDGRLLASEADIVDATRRNHIADIFLIDHRPTPDELAGLADGPPDAARRFAEEHAAELVPNPRLLRKIASADLVIYAPGTQHSSLLPSYMTPGLGSAISANLTAVKVLVTNIQEDAEIPDVSAFEIMEKAAHYLREKSRLAIPTPCLITHCLINDPSRPEPGTSYVPLGRVQSLEDPRLVRVANFEDGTTGYHNARMVLTPFIESLLASGRRPSVAVLLLDAHSPNKISQTLLEALRGGLADVGAEVTCFYASPESLPVEFTRSLPCPVQNVWTAGESDERAFLRVVRAGSGERAWDYALLFESSGMYRGEDIVNVASLLASGRLDSVWGSRRLSLRDIRESYKLRYRRHPLLGAVSYVGSHLLSLAYLVLYGRYLSDTLSGVRALRARYLARGDIDLGHKRLNQHLLSMLLRDGGEVFETPVQFFSMSPEQVRRTTVTDGLTSVAQILWWRLRPPREAAGGPPADVRTGSVPH